MLMMIMKKMMRVFIILDVRYTMLFRIIVILHENEQKHSIIVIHFPLDDVPKLGNIVYLSLTMSCNYEVAYI